MRCHRNQPTCGAGSHSLILERCRHDSATIISPRENFNIELFLGFDRLKGYFVQAPARDLRSALCLFRQWVLSHALLPDLRQLADNDGRNMDEEACPRVNRLVRGINIKHRTRDLWGNTRWRVYLNRRLMAVAGFRRCCFHRGVRSTMAGFSLCSARAYRMSDAGA